MISVGGASPSAHSYFVDYHYKKITDDTSGTEVTVWTPASGKLIHIMAVLVSVTGAGVVEFKDGTAGDTIAMFEFNEKKTVPFTPGMELALPKDHTLKVKFTIGSGSGDCHITAFGNEH